MMILRGGSTFSQYAPAAISKFTSQDGCSVSGLCLLKRTQNRSGQQTHRHAFDEEFVSPAQEETQTDPASVLLPDRVSTH